MNEFYTEFTLKGLGHRIGIAFMAVLAALGTYMAIGAVIQHEWYVLFYMGLFAMVFVVLTVRIGVSYSCKDVWRMGIRSETLWWDSPRWPRSKGSVPMADICKMVIRESKHLNITTTNGMVHSVCNVGNPEGLRDFLHEYYPDKAVKFIVDGS